MDAIEINAATLMNRGSTAVREVEYEQSACLLVASQDMDETRNFAAMLCPDRALPRTEHVQQWLNSTGDTESLARSVATVFGDDKMVVLPVDSAGLALLSTRNAKTLSGVGTLLCYTHPESAVLAAMAAGNDPAEGLHDWVERSRKLLRVFKRNRTGTLVVNLDTAREDPGALQACCRRHFGIDLSPGSAVIRADEQSASDMHKLIAAQMVAQSEAANDVLAELMASAVMPGENRHPEIDFPGIVEQLEEPSAAQAMIADVQAQVTDAKEENELLLLQLHQVQEELEQHYLRLQEQIKTNIKLKQQSEEASRKLATHEKALAAERKTTHEQNQKLKTISAQERSKHRKLAAIYASTSWKITKPLRFTRRLFNRKRVDGKV